MSDNVKNRRLGRGLDALMGDSQSFLSHENDDNLQKTLLLSQIGPNRYNPRKHFKESELADLSKSIAEKGVLQPILVRTVADREYVYEIVAGERRWRASKLANRESIPTIIVDLNDKEALEVAIIENVQRENLSAIEEAVGLGQLIDQFDYTQEEVAKVLGKSRSYVTNIMRLLKLPDEIKQMVEDESLTAGHARALLGRSNALELANTVVKESMSVRGIEQLIREQEGRDDKKASTTEKSEQKTVKIKTSETLALESKIAENLGVKVAIDFNEDGKGSMKLTFQNMDELENICDRLGA